jgi:hypothetical protein
VSLEVLKGYVSGGAPALFATLRARALVPGLACWLWGGEVFAQRLVMQVVSCRATAQRRHI